MGSKTTTTQDSAFKYDPTSMGLAQGGWKAALPLLKSYMSPNITGSPFFRLALQQGMQQADLLGQTGMSNFFGNLAAGGGGAQALAPFQQAMLSRLGRQTSGLRSNAFWSAYGQGLGAQEFALSQAMGYRPLETGQHGTAVSKKSGLGTWLPQVIAGAASIGLAPFTGGASLAGLTRLGGIPGQEAAGQSAFSSGAYNPLIQQSPYLTAPAPVPGSGTPWLIS